LKSVNPNIQILLKKLKILLFIVLSLFLWVIQGIVYGQNNFIKALYVDDFFSADSSEIILGNEEAEQNLFDYAENCGYNYLILYGLSAVPLGSQAESVEALKSFVRRAHEDYNIKLGCVGQSSNFFKRIHEKYQSLDTVAAIERLDSYNLEFEFWKSFNSGIYQGYYCENYLEPNGYSCDSIGAFEFAMDELSRIDSLAMLFEDSLLFEETSKIQTEIYIGWINEYHAEVLAQKMQDSIIDRILGAVYKPPLEDGSLELYNFYHQTRRLGFLGSQGNPVNFLPIFAVKESEGNHLGDWMDSIGSIPYVWEHYESEYLNDTSAYTNNINLQGYVWYNHSNMPLCFDGLGFQGFVEGPEGELIKDSVYVFSLNNSENATRFYWELPEGVLFADSSKWGAAVHLRFQSHFQEGDSIAVRPANRCYLGEKQFYLVNDFNGISDAVKTTNPTYYKDGILYIYNLQNYSYYQIYNTLGQLLQKGPLNPGENAVYFNGESGVFFILAAYKNQGLTQKFFIP
jgi:hypothetical protein